MVSATGEMIDDDPSHQGSLGMTENRSSEVLIAVDISTTNSSRSESLQISSSENYICNDEVNILQKSTTRTKPKPKKKSCLRCYVSSLAHTLLCVFVVFFLLIFFWEINSLFLDMEARRPDRISHMRDQLINDLREHLFLVIASVGFLASICICVKSCQ